MKCEVCGGNVRVKGSTTLTVNFNREEVERLKKENEDLVYALKEMIAQHCCRGNNSDDNINVFGEWFHDSGQSANEYAFGVLRKRKTSHEDG